MPNCPHCGEPYRRGQDKCYACGQPVRAIRARGRKAPVNPLVFVIGGVALVLAILAVVLLIPRSGREQAEKARQAEEDRVRDSVRRANRMQRQQASESSEMARLEAEVNKLQSRFRTVKGQVVGESPSDEQQRLVGRINQGISGLRVLVRRIDAAPPDRKPALKDTLREDERQVRSLLSDLARTPPTR